MRAAPWRVAGWALLAGLAAGPSSCARNPATGKNEIALVSESQEIQMGQQYAQQIVRSMGVYDDKKVQDYVSRLGMGMAAKSERPQLPWAFYVMDDPTVNAFALPGGSIFVTRGILTHMNNEAELVGVLGHEIGHVTARHSVQQMTRQQIAQIGLGVGSIISSDVAQYAGLASQGLGVLFLKYGRDAESQSDQLGFKYMVRDGYDPRAMATMFQTLQRVSKLEGAGDIPEWASTHPDPGNRVQATMERVDTLSVPNDQAQHQAGGVPAGRGGNALWGRPEAGLHRRQHLLPPRPSVQAGATRWVAGAEHSRGARGREPPAGRDAPAYRAREGHAG